MAKNKVNEALLIDDEVDKVYASKQEEKLQKKIAKIEAKYNKKIQKIENQNKKEKKSRVVTMKNALVTGLCGIMLLGSTMVVKNFDSIKNFFDRDNNNPGVSEREDNTGKDKDDNKQNEQEDSKDKDEGEITAEFDVNGNTYRVYSGKNGVTTKITPSHESSKPAQSKTTGSTTNNVGVPEGSMSQEEHDKQTAQEIQERVDNGETKVDLNKGVTAVVDERTETEISGNSTAPSSPEQQDNLIPQPLPEKKLDLDGRNVVKADGNNIQTQTENSTDFQAMDSIDFEDLER